jgi:hypothetical protein
MYYKETNRDGYPDVPVAGKERILAQGNQARLLPVSQRSLATILRKPAHRITET